jgi:hypothetical protein
MIGVVHLALPADMFQPLSQPQSQLQLQPALQTATLEFLAELAAYCAEEELKVATIILIQEAEHVM